MRFMLSLLVLLFVAGCTTTHEVGGRGSAKLYRTRSWWPVTYPYSIIFEPMALDRAGSCHFRVRDLREARIDRFDLRVHSKSPLLDESQASLNKLPLKSAGFCSTHVRLRISDESGAL